MESVGVDDTESWTGEFPDLGLTGNYSYQIDKYKTFEACFCNYFSCAIPTCNCFSQSVTVFPGSGGLHIFLKNNWLLLKK